ncbi:MAG TPA: D-alanyl-D-alanine carboxypeptidase/D-alanyl-D-alanine-endopeptidase [Steroidobacteraceae bacterium]|nr:D-alanyl-D-alanine carboxypeptidase/D-alanyl-D-alanine-endopeptidase [Steroidobacteraceae bacterium]
MIPPPRRALAAILASAAAALAAGAGAAPLPARIEQVLHSEALPASAVSIVVRDALSGESYLELNAREPRSPASTIKVLTTFAALDQLGPAYHWTTRAFGTGPVADGRLLGDLVLRGGGDPYLTAERWWRFARELRNTGLKRIDGDIVIDRTLYALQEPEADEFDGRGDRVYNVLPDALLVNFQAVEFHFVPEASRVRVIVDPEPANLRLSTSIRAADGACDEGLKSVTFTTYEDEPDRLALTGRLSRHCPPSVARRAIMRAPDFAYGTFVTAWREQGGEFAGRLRLDSRPDGARPLAEFESLSLAEVVRLLNKYSNNTMARMLVLTLAWERYGAPATVANGERALAEWLARQGLAFPELVIDNGSGLSRRTRIAADSMARVLAAAYRSRYFPELAASLPLGGQDGTLKRRFADLAGEGRVRLKTGHLSGVGAVAGWVTSRSGRPLAVVVIVNHPGAEFSAQPVIDTIVRWALDR